MNLVEHALLAIAVQLVAPGFAFTESRERQILAAVRTELCARRFHLLCSVLLFTLHDLNKSAVALAPDEASLLQDF